MTESEQKNRAAAPGADQADPSEAGAADAPSLRNRWQGPLLFIATTLLIGGLLTARITAPRDDFDGALDDVAALIERGEHERALSLLNDRIRPNLDEAQDTPEVRGRFHLLRGDALYNAQDALAARAVVNDEAIVAEYEAAQQYLAEFSPEQIARHAYTLLALGRTDEALARLEAIPEGRAQVRRRLLRRIIEHNLGRPQVPFDETLALLNRLASEEGLPEDDRLWVIGRQAELRLAAGYAEEALNRLLVEMQRLGELSGPEAGRLYHLLGRAYFELGRIDRAEESLEDSLARLPAGDALRAHAHALIGRILQDRRELDLARDRFLRVISEFPASAAHGEALLGLAEVEAARGATQRAADAYRRLADTATGPTSRTPTRGEVLNSLLDRVSERLAMEDYETALEFAQIAREIGRTEAGQDPGAALAAARAHRLLADRMMEPARREGSLDVSAVDPVTLAEAKSHYLAAGEAFLEHARGVILEDDDAFADSLWSAADSFDLGGDLDKAIEVFNEYVTSRPEDPRRPAAVFRLAQAHQARGEPGAAREFYEQLIEQNPSSGEGTRARVWLARLLLADDDAENDARAEQSLRNVVDDGLLEPDAIEFRDALVELGRLHLARGELQEAIRRLSEVVRRYPDSPMIEAHRTWLADAHRRSADAIAQTLEQAMPDTRRAELQRLRDERLREALRLYELVRASLEREPAERLTALEQALLRDAYFHRADCAFDLGEYERAIDHYDAAAQRYADDPASLLAMAQIVNAYVAQGRWSEARTANERARRRLAEMPEGVFEGDGLATERRHWERWLESTEALSQRAQAGGEEG